MNRMGEHRPLPGTRPRDAPHALHTAPRAERGIWFPPHPPDPPAAPAAVAPTPAGGERRRGTFTF